MSSFRRQLILSGAGFLLRRAWGRKLMWKATEHIVDEGAHQAMNPAAWEHLLHDAAEALMTPLYFLVGLADDLYGQHPPSGAATQR
jgi:hypothetical protein